METNPPLFQETTEDPVQSDAPPMPIHTTPNASAKRLWLIALGSIIVCVSILSIWKILHPPPKPITTVILSPTPTPTPIRILSPVATEGGFLRLVEYQASLSAALSVTNLDDPSLSPPTIELPLGFKP